MALSEDTRTKLVEELNNLEARYEYLIGMDAKALVLRPLHNRMEEIEEDLAH